MNFILIIIIIERFLQQIIKLDYIQKVKVINNKIYKSNNQFSKYQTTRIILFFISFWLAWETTRFFWPFFYRVIRIHTIRKIK